jgi:hypothetical protein
VIIRGSGTYLIKVDFMDKIISFLVFFFLFSACNNSPKFDLAKEHKELRDKAEGINNDFRKIRTEVDTLAAEISKLYELQNHILKGIDRSKYMFASNGIFTKPFNDGGSAIFVSGYYPINEDVKKVVYFTEPIDTVFRKLVNKYPEIVQVYYNDKSSLNRIYPFFDVLSQYEAKMDIPSFNFYYLADSKHNPERKSLWVNEPYVDPAGRGWMVSAIAPVYYRDSLAGVPGIDVTINRITKRYILDNQENMTIIVDNTGAIVAAQESAINLLSFPPLFEHKYVETIKQDTYRKETYSLALSKEARVRAVAIDILENKKDHIEAEINGDAITILVAFIPELSWYLLEILR